MADNLSFIDIHCHLDLCANYEDMIKRALEKNVKIILSQGVNPSSNRKVLEINKKFKSVKAVLGTYPIDALKLSENELKKEIEFIKENRKKVNAIGEVGLDFKEDEKNHKKQKEIFEKFIKLSIEMNIPIVVHSRKAEKEAIEVLERFGAKKVVMHCFSGKTSLVNRIIKNNWFITIPTIITRSEHFQNIVKITPLGNLFCETDSPYLHPKKEWPNEPANVIESYKKIAEIKKMNLKDVRNQIYSNFINLFR